MLALHQSESDIDIIRALTEVLNNSINIPTYISCSKKKASLKVYHYLLLSKFNAPQYTLQSPFKHFSEFPYYRMITKIVCKNSIILINFS